MAIFRSVISARTYPHTSASAITRRTSAVNVAARPGPRLVVGPLVELGLSRRLRTPPVVEETERSNAEPNQDGWASRIKEA